MIPLPMAQVLCAKFNLASRKGARECAGRDEVTVEKQAVLSQSLWGNSPFEGWNGLQGWSNLQDFSLSGGGGAALSP